MIRIRNLRIDDSDRATHRGRSIRLAHTVSSQNICGGLALETGPDTVYGSPRNERNAFCERLPERGSEGDEQVNGGGRGDTGWARSRPCGVYDIASNAGWDRRRYRRPRGRGHLRLVVSGSAKRSIPRRDGSPSPPIAATIVEQPLETSVVRSLDAKVRDVVHRGDILGTLPLRRLGQRGLSSAARSA
jgi:hypothetical protein